MSPKKVRPSWADSSTTEHEEEEQAAGAAVSIVEPEQAEPDPGPDQPERVSTVAEEQPYPRTDYGTPSTGGSPSAPSSGKKTMGGEAQQRPGHDQPERTSSRDLHEPEGFDGHDNQTNGAYCSGLSYKKEDVEREDRDAVSYPYQGSSRSGSSAPARVKAAISSFVERISGRGAESVPGGGEEAGGPRQEPPEQVEKRLKLALRETSIEGFRRICVGSPKGGVGKSSLAYSIAGAISYCTNLRVCLVDADPNYGATRFLVPRPVEQSVLDLADDADSLQRLADLRSYVSQNEQMGLDVLLNPVEAAQISHVEDLAQAYARVDAVLSKFYDLTIYDLGLGFRDEAIRGVLGLSDELVLISDAEVIPNAQLPDALRYVEGLGVNLQKTTLAINHGRPPEHESASTAEVRGEHAAHVRRVTEVPYDAALSRMLNTRAFHIDRLALPARLGVLTTAAAALEGLRRDAWTNGYEKVLSMHPDRNTKQKGGS